jgi:hypothetical protein
VSVESSQPPPESGSSPPSQPITQKTAQQRTAEWRKAQFSGWVWWQQRPKRNFPAEPDPDFQLVSNQTLEELSHEFNLSPAAVARIRHDLAHLDHELLRYFRETDHAAKKFQNGFRLYNVRILILAAVATMIGALQAISLSIDASLLLVLGAAETIVALYTVYVVNTRSQDASLDDWLKNRRQSEQLRREFFRYLLYLPPYMEGELEYERKRKLSRRAASIYADQFPEEPSILEGTQPTLPGTPPPSIAYHADDQPNGGAG